MKNIECFVFDMDGTINLGDQLIDGALDLIEYLQQNDIKFFFFTNNSSKSPEEYIEKLHRLGFKNMKREHIATSGDVMIHYLKNKFENPSVYLAGAPALKQQFASAGIDISGQPRAVVVGFDTTWDFQKANDVCTLVSRGLPFLATNVDKICPMEYDEFLPDCGSICAMVTHATDIKPKFVGKPSKETVDYIIEKSGTKNIAIVGDRLYTDIATAINGNVMGIAVLSGEITREDIDHSPVKPHYVFESVKELHSALVACGC